MSVDLHEPLTIAACPRCATQLAPAMLACPRCGWLVNGDRLQSLAQTAGAAEANGDSPAALAAWREALELLPPDSRQYQTIIDRITALGDGGPASPAARSKSGGRAQRPPRDLAALACFSGNSKPCCSGLPRHRLFSRCFCRWASTGSSLGGSLPWDWCSRSMSMKWDMSLRYDGWDSKQATQCSSPASAR